MRVEPTPEGRSFDRRALLRKAATAGAVGWTVPVIVSSSPVSAGVFTAKCAPGTVTATATFATVLCQANSSTMNITINFAGSCPCGGTGLWCTQKNTPTPVVTGTTATLVLPNILIPISPTINIAGRVALGCTDRDGDRQYAVYNWTMTARDNGGACNTAFQSITQPVLSNRTLVTSASCPSLAAAAVFSATATPPPGVVRPPN